MNGRFAFPVYQENGKKIIGQTGRHLMWKKIKKICQMKHLGRKTNWIYPLNIPTEDDVFLNASKKKERLF